MKALSKSVLMSVAGSLLLSAVPALAGEYKRVTMHSVNDEGTGESVGVVTLKMTEHGLVFTPAMKGLPAGAHGFHVHENGSCEPKTSDGKVTPAGAAGSHLDPKSAGHHDAPWGDGHLGDLPTLHVAEDGTASIPVLAPRLKLKQVKGKALMVHQGGDNYSDEPKPLGGGGARIACGVIK